MAISSFSGLASGVQWQDLIDQIIAAQSAPITRLQTQQKAIEAQKTAWASFRTKVAALETSAKGLADATRLRGLTTTVQNLSGGTTAALRASASTAAEAGSYRVDVLSLATAEKLGGKSFTSRTDALNLGGTILVNGRALTLDATDSLDKVAARFNDLNTGTSPSGVAAAVVATGQGGYRLVLTSAARGAAGMDLKAAGGTALRDLGLVDDTTTLKHALPTGARSDSFTANDAKVGQLLGLSTAPSGNVTIGGTAVALDLANQTLDQVAAAINLARSNTAQVITETTNGTTSYRLEISGTTSFEDPNGILETLGVLKATRTSAQQQLKSAAFMTGGTTPATESTLLTALDGAPALDDTIRLAGTRADGSAYQVELTVKADTTLQSVLDVLNGALGPDTANPLRPTATAKLEAGQLVVTDDATGDSALSLSLTKVSGNAATEWASVSTTTVGRTRVLAAGSDALIKVDGAYLTRATNEITDAIPGLTFNLATTGTVNVDVARDANSATGAITGFVTAYNELADFVTGQLTPAAAGGTAPPLYGQSTLRSMQASLKTTLQATVAGGIAGTLTRMADIGVEIDRYGKFTIDQAKLSEAVKTRPADVERFFGVSTSSGSSALEYVTSSSATKSGVYDVAITASATHATRIGAALGTWAGGDDSITITDRATGKAYSVQFAASMTAEELAGRLNTEFGTATAHTLTSTGTVTGDTSTALTAAGLGLADGDTLAIAGKRANGTSFTTDLVVTGKTTGDLLAAVQEQFGGDATVTLEGGNLVVTAAATGTSQIELAITKAGTPVLGTIETTTEGRPKANITAAVAGDAVTLTHASYGSADGFTIAYGSAAATGVLGDAGTVQGTDVAGSINNEAATGTGRTLKAATGDAAEGLLLTYTGTAPATTNFTFSRGIGALAEAAAKALTQANTGAIDALTQRLDDRIQQLGDRADTLEMRLESRREMLVRQFTAMEQAMSMAQQQSAWLTSQMAAFENKKK